MEVTKFKKIIVESPEVGGYNRGLMLRKIRRSAALVMLLLSIAFILWAALPNKHRRIVQSIAPAGMAIAQNGEVGSMLSMPARQVELEWPESMRIGEDGTISLVFEPVEVDDISPSQGTGYTDIYTRFNIMAEARYDVAGVNLVPANPTRESMPSSQPVKFYWKVNTDQVGTFNGTVWLSLRYLPLDGSQVKQVPIYVREITTRTVSLIGLTEGKATILGGVGILVAAILIYDDLINLVRKWVRKNFPQINTDKN